MTAAAPADDGPTPDAVRCRRGQLLARSAAGTILRRGRARPHLRVPRQCQGYRLAVRSSGPQREQSSSSSDDNGLERRTCRPSPRAARPGGRSPPTSWRSWPVPVSQSPRSGLWCHDRESCRGGLEHAQQPLERPQIALVLHTFQAATGGPGRRGVIYSSPQPDRVNSTDRVNSIRLCLRDELVDAATVRADHAWLPRHDRSWLVGADDHELQHCRMWRPTSSQPAQAVHRERSRASGRCDQPSRHAEALRIRSSSRP